MTSVPITKLTPKTTSVNQLTSLNTLLKENGSISITLSLLKKVKSMEPWSEMTHTKPSPSQELNTECQPTNLPSNSELPPVTMPPTVTSGTLNSDMEKTLS